MINTYFPHNYPSYNNALWSLRSADRCSLMIVTKWPFEVITLISALEINLLLSLLTFIYSNTYHYSRESDTYNIYIVKNSSYYNGENYSMLYNNTQAFDKELQDLTEYCQLIQTLRFTKPVK